jgi:hypothetical protein
MGNNERQVYGRRNTRQCTDPICTPLRNRLLKEKASNVLAKEVRVRMVFRAVLVHPWRKVKR